MSLAQLCVVYVVKEVASFPGLGQLMGVAHVWATDEPGSFRKDVKLLITVVYSRETVYILCKNL